MASSTQDLVQKKLVYLYLCNYAESHADLTVLVCRRHFASLAISLSATLCPTLSTSLVSFIHSSVVFPGDQYSSKELSGSQPNDSGLGFAKHVPVASGKPCGICLATAPGWLARQVTVRPKNGRDGMREAFLHSAGALAMSPNCFELLFTLLRAQRCSR